MRRDTFPTGPLGCNCSLLLDAERKQAVVVDPGGDDDLIIQKLEQAGCSVSSIIITHAHIDHLGAIPALQKRYGCPVYLNEHDRPLWENVDIQAQMLRIPRLVLPEFEAKLDDEATVAVGSQALNVMFTPGHTPGSVCFHAPNHKLLITGDTLFAGSIGRTDLWGGSYETIMDSIHQRLMTLPEDTLVIPGHGPSTSIGEELRHNPFLQDR